MTELRHVKELLQTGIGTEGQLLIPRKIADTLVEEVDKALIPAQLTAMAFGPGDIPGSSIDVDLVTPRSMDVREVGEGAAVPLDNNEYTSFNLKPLKYGVAIRITRELQEDSKFALLQQNVRTAGKRLAENMNSLVISDALDNANNTVAGGAAITIANITRAMQHLEDEDYRPTDFIVGFEVLNDLRNIDTFVEADKAGDTQMLSTGFRGRIFGMNVHAVSTNAGMTTTSSYVLDRQWAYVTAEKRAITVEGFDLPTHDMTGTVVTHRFATRQLRAEAIAKITTT